ncbi:uncharacterized oxidoreductase Mb2924c [Arthrobacter sp. Hiyo8]|nr:uncharacterized oxidoreductase Mb2924c [Arthrobacter sp. Hiyo8]
MNIVSLQLIYQYARDKNVTDFLLLTARPLYPAKDLKEKPMASRAPRENIDESTLTVTKPKSKAVGLPAVTNALKISLEQMGPLRSVQTLLAVNQVDGFDCMGCAWPEHDKRHTAEFCENGAKAVAEEATRRRVTPEFFASHSIAELKTRDDYWLGQQGRLTHPMLLDEGATHYRPVEWDDALELIAQEIRDMDSPDQAVFYTSGRTSNEAAFAYQLLVRGVGTNNLPDCSNMCHESSGSALVETIGIGKGSVSLKDVETASLIFVAGQNPGTNHPRMLSSLEKAKKNGAVIVSVNPLPEAGLLKFENPQNVVGMMVGTELTDDFLQIRAGGDQALFQGLGKYLLEAESAGRTSPGLRTVFDHDFISKHTVGLDAYVKQLEDVAWEDILEATGLTMEQIEATGERLLASKATIVCWAMGLTQHKHSVPTLRDVVNVLLLQGNIGKPGPESAPSAGIPMSRATAPWAFSSKCRRSSTTGWTKSSNSSPPGPTATIPSQPSGRCGTARSGFSSGWAATLCGRPRL